MSGKEKEKKKNDKSVGRRPRCTRDTARQRELKILTKTIKFKK